jgi:glycosyltransferase involved in cell wall biosynthesis
MTDVLAKTSPKTCDPIPLTTIVLTQDEEINIQQCLDCLRRVDDVVIVDSGSTDATLNLAAAARPQVRIYSHPFQDFADQRNWALTHTEPKHEWVLFVDADEFCTPELLKEIAGFLADPGIYVGAFISGKNYLLGRWLRHCTLYPAPQLRLLKRGRIFYQKHGHGQREVADGQLVHLRQSWRHEGFSKGVAEWIARHNFYSTQEVDLLLAMRKGVPPWRDAFSRDRVQRGRALKVLSARLPLRPLSTFFYLYVVRRGFLDGYPGFLYCALMMGHHINLMAKSAERQHVEGVKAKIAAMSEAAS